MTANSRDLATIVLILTVFSTPLVIMYAYQLIDSIAQPDPGSLVPGDIDLSSWRFLVGTDRRGAAINLGRHLQHVSVCKHDSLSCHVIV